MTTKIDEDVMCLEINGTVWRLQGSGADGWWEVSYWPRFFDHGQAITALTVTRLLDSGRDSDDPVVPALREELR
jgi:hypothetical protein